MKVFGKKYFISEVLETREWVSKHVVLWVAVNFSDGREQLYSVFLFQSCLLFSLSTTSLQITMTLNIHLSPSGTFIIY